MYLGLVAKEQTIEKSAQVKWVSEESHLTILSSNYEEPTNYIKMVNSFSLEIWIFILISIMMVTFILTLKNKLISN